MVIGVMSDVASSEVFPDLVSPSECEKARLDGKLRFAGELTLSTLEIASAVAMFIAVLMLRI